VPDGLGPGLHSGVGGGGGGGGGEIKRWAPLGDDCLCPVAFVKRGTIYHVGHLGRAVEPAAELSATGGHVEIQVPKGAKQLDPP